MNEKPKRRWFRFSLRTLFVVVTIFGVWLGWQLKIVRERKALLAEMGGEQPTLEEMEADPSGQDRLSATRFQYARVPLYRRLLGDKSYPDLAFAVQAATSSPLLERIERAFPESMLDVYISDGSDMPTRFAFRDSLYAPASVREPNQGTIFKTGLIEK